MLESDERTQLADFLIETSYAYSLNITSVEARKIANALIDNNYRPASTVKTELLKEISSHGIAIDLNPNFDELKL